MSTARGGLRGPQSAPGGYSHKPEPAPGTIRSVRIGVDPYAVPMEYPHEARCMGCDQVIRLGQEMPIGPIGTWKHTGRVVTE